MYILLIYFTKSTGLNYLYSGSVLFLPLLQLTTLWIFNFFQQSGEHLLSVLQYLSVER